jgi:hypothetical protein
MSASVLRRMSLLPTAKLTGPPLLDRSWHLFGGFSSSSVPDGQVRVVNPGACSAITLAKRSAQGVNRPPGYESFSPSLKLSPKTTNELIRRQYGPAGPPPGSESAGAG